MTTLRVGPAFCAALWLLGASCASTQPRPMPVITPSQWHDDLAYFARELPARHKNAFHHVTRDSFEHAVAQLDARVGTLSNGEIYCALRSITAAIGDGHTGLILPTNFHRYGIAIRSFGGEYRVVRAAPEAGALLGGRVVRIGDVPIAEAADRVRSIVAQAENEWYVRASVPQWLVIAESVHYLGLSAGTAHAVYTVEDSTGREVSATLSALPIDTPPAAWTMARVDTPLYQRTRGAPLWFEPLAHDSCLYACFTGYNGLARYTHALWSYVDHHPGGTLIVDLRRNEGGNFNTGRHELVHPAQSRLASGRLRALYVLIGNVTFSAAMVNAIDFRKQCHATLVGEPIGERPNSYSEKRLMTLPHSRLVVTYSVKYYRFQDQDEPPTVMPDVTIEPTWEQYRAGRDPVLDWVLANRAGAQARR